MLFNPSAPVHASCPVQSSPDVPTPAVMAEEDPQQQGDRGARSLPGLLTGLQGAEASALQLRIKNSICKSVQSKVENILQDVEKFSDIEKLYLYLKLPSGPSSSADKSDQSALSSSRTQQMHAFNWIRHHLEEYPETSLPKQEVYDEYKSFCDNLNYHPLSAADFGKMMKNVFPNMKARRLGMRGKSKYCYSGLRKRPFVHMPSLPVLDLHKTGDGLQCDVLESPGQLSSIKEDVRFAACDLVCEWAQKVLKRQFDAVEDLARFLIDSHYISNKSLAALTIMTGTATEVKPPQTVSAFVPTAAEAHSYQPHVATLSSPSVDAKQQLQRKIQRKQQEQKLQSPSPGEPQTKRADNSVPCASPAPPSPQPTIGIVVAAVPSPITVQRSRQLMSPSPMGAVESKMLPINFQMVTQPVQAVKQSPKTPQNILTPVGDRSARQRYPQILPKPTATTAITLRSPSAMIIGNSPVKTVMTTCHVSPVSLVKMTAISLAPNSSNTTTSLTNATLRPASACVGSSAGAEDISSNQNMRSTSAVPILAPVARPSETTNTVDVEMEVEAIHKNSQMQNPGGQILTQEATANRAGGALQRAASVPIPQSKGFLGLEDTSTSKCNDKSPSSTVAAVESNNSANNISINTNNTSALHLSPSTHNTSAASLLNTSRPPSFGEGSSVTSAKDGFLSTKSLRKRSGLTPDLSPIKRVFMPQQPELEGAAGLGYGIRNTTGNILRPGAPTRPESAPATREVETKMNSSQVHALCTSSFRASGFYSVAKTQSTMQSKNTSTVMETSTSVSRALIQQQQGHMVANVHAMTNNSGLQTQSGVCDVQSSAAGSLEGAQQHTYTQSNPADCLNQASSSSQLPMQTDMDYFSFDDDVTQDSIVEELVQMEEQMKLNNLQEFRDSVALQDQQAAMQDNTLSTSQTITAFYHAANNSSSNLIQTPTPTPTPTSEVTGGTQGLTGESPFSRIASTTPVDSALGSSRHTPVGTPHSNCSSTVPPSPVECRNPFAFTPINSSITGFHDSSTVSSSPVKPMQRPMATHPDKTRLEWMNNNYNSSSGSLNKSNSGILPSYQGLIGDHFQKPHAFAVPHARHHDSHFGRLTPISPVQQQVASMAKQEGFAVPAPLDNKATSTAATTFRCRSVSPAVHQRNMSGNTGNLPHVPRSVVSPFNSPVTPEMLNIFANSQTNLGVSSMAQRSHSVPLNIMMQTEVLPTPGQQCNSKNITNVLLSKLDGDHDDTVRGLGINNLPSSYTARMNLTQLLESDPNLSCSDSHFSLMTSESNSTCKLQRPNYLIENAINEQMILPAGDSLGQSASGEQHPQRAQSMLLTVSSQPHQEELQQHLDFSSTVKDLLTDNRLTAGSQLMEQVSELTTGTTDFPCEIRMTSELSSSINDLNALDTDLLFDPNQQQGQYQNVSAEEELVNDALFQQITSEATHSSGLDWLESKDHPTVGLMG
ncbi:LOW QUALITY PROTEIN: DNA-binding protein RFX7-like [Plectropomus leopardus]|uniref:LOW QUALITY PROTEIN: DNA-binding protein RFX7-like n=1 Tax=Plectropomus leopardus TaxID=160734 RepID=UPI001C4B3ECC|nr:LOW QUALITY PROTEIN: DNA-binding protein RFX7-like [Plectropomus leopardus]